MKKIILVLFLACTAFTYSLFGQTKIAVIDMAKVFDGYQRTKVVQLQLQKQNDVFRAQAETLNAARLKLEDEYKALRDAAMNSILTEAEQESKRLAAQDKNIALELKKEEIIAFNRETTAKMNKMLDDMRATVLADIHGVIQNKCLLEGYQLVLDKSGMTMNSISTVVYHTKDMDITDSVLETLNRGYSMDAANPLKGAEEAGKTEKGK